MKQSVLIALLGSCSAVKLGDWYDRDASEDYMSDGEKHNYFIGLNGKTYDLAHHGKLVSEG